MIVSIIIPVWNQLEYTQRCIESLFIHTDYPFRLCIVDNNSDKETAEFLDGLFDKYIDNDAYNGSQYCHSITVSHQTENLGFVKAINLGIRMSTGDHRLLLNNDTEVTAEWLSRMMICLTSDERIRVVNPVFNNPMPGGLFFEPPANLTNDEVATLIDVVSEQRYPDICTAVGFCMLIHCEAIHEFGLLDEAYHPGIGEESDFCMRVTESGYRVVCADDAYVYHKGRVSFDLVDPDTQIAQEHLQLFLQRWGTVWKRDVTKFNEVDPLHYLREGIKQVQYNA